MDPKIAQFVEGHEGRVRRPYQCPAGFWSYGVGRNLQTNKLTLEETLFLLEHGPGDPFIDLLLKNDMDRCWTEASACIGQNFTGWPQARQAAVISMLFNLGLTGFLQFRKMVDALRNGRWEIAADESLDSERARQLPRRSAEEALMISSGDWTKGG
jgi:lysozyme